MGIDPKEPKIGYVPSYVPTSLPSKPEDLLLASVFYKRLQASIEEAQTDLKEDEALCLLCPTAEGAIVVEDIGYHNPFLMVFYGRDSEGNASTALIHVYSTQLLLKNVKLRKKEERKPIGFRR